jgi:hypothetical protein
LGAIRLNPGGYLGGYFDIFARGLPLNPWLRTLVLFSFTKRGGNLKKSYFTTK